MLTNIQTEYENLYRKTLADEATSVYNSGKMFAFDDIMREEVVTFAKNTNSSPNVKTNPQRRLLNAMLLLFIKPYPAGTRKAKKYINPDITKVSVTVNGSPDKIYNNGIEAKDMWRKISCFFQPKKVGSTMDLTKFYKDNI